MQPLLPCYRYKGNVFANTISVFKVLSGEAACHSSRDINFMNFFSFSLSLYEE